jgi:chemotaxis protein MotB
MSAPRRPHRKKGGHEEEHEANHERWLLTYADMITLLMVLFIVLFASSTISTIKFAELADGLAKQLGGQSQVIPGGTGVLDGGQTTSADHGVQTNNPSAPIQAVQEADQQHLQPSQAAAAATQAQLAAAEQQTLAGARAKIEAALKAKGLEDSVRFTTDSRGLTVSIVTDKLLFNTGQATLQPAGDEVLDAIGPALRLLPNNISVEGHTDNVPISGGVFASNWELSAVRATTVLRYLVATDGLQETRMSATGYADTKPLVPNDTAAHRAVNRRVDVVVLSTLLNTTAASTSTADPTPSATAEATASSVQAAGGNTSTLSTSPSASTPSVFPSPVIPDIRPSLAPAIAQGVS